MRLDLRTASIRRLYLGFLVPTIIATVSNSLYCLADIYFISIGSGMLGLAAVNIVMPLYTIYSAIGLLFGVGASTVISIERGSGRDTAANEAFTLCMILLVLCGVILGGLSLLFLEPLAYALGATEELLPYVMEYMRPIVIGTLTFILMYACGILLRSDHAPKLAMISMLIGNISNIFLDYLCVVVLGWGLSGAAIATAFAPLITLGIASSHFILRHHQLHLCKPHDLIGLLRRIIANGAGSGILELTSGLIIFLFNAVILAIADATFLAAYAIVANIAYVLKGLFAAFGQAAQPIMSYNYGAREQKRVQATFHFAMGVTLIAAFALYVTFLLFPRPLADIFAHGDVIVGALGAQGIILYFLSMPFTAFNTMLMYYFQSVECGRLSTLLAVAKGVVFIVIGIGLLFLLFQEMGIWLTVPFAEMMACLLGIFFYHRWKRSI